MDVPFVSSGAMSRAQYGLVRKVENATTPQATDQVLLNELDVIRRKLQQQHLSIRSCKECLILILHCTMSLSTVSPGDLEFAFPHAINLAELGQSPMDKKIGYIFCMELMSPHHELQLMLVNTLRKDLESTSVPRICLALEVLIQIPSEHVIPAVDVRVQALIHHEVTAVRRRALMACYTLFKQDAERLSHLEDVIRRRLRSHPGEITSLSAVARKLKHAESLARVLNFQLQRWYRDAGELGSVFGILRTLRMGEMKLEPEGVPVVFDIIKRASNVPMRDVLREAFMLLSTLGPESLRESQLSTIAVISIRHFLSSGNPNDVYLFVSCLSCLDPSIWAGTLPNTVAILDEWEVQGIMKLLDSPDALIRKTTLGILNSVDPAIVETYYSQALRNLLPSFSIPDRNEYVSRLLEIINMQGGSDVDQYARHLKELFSVVEGGEFGSTESLPVLDLSVQQILNSIRERDIPSRISCVTALAVPLTEPEVRVGPTLMVIIAALVSEYCGKISVSPMRMLHGIAARLASYPASVRDTCLLTMLKLSVECDKVPEEVTIAVQQLSEHSGTYLRNRCNQFLTLSNQRRVLSQIISRASSSSLPDFHLALTSYQINPNPRSMFSKSPGTSSEHRESLDSSPSRGVTSPRKLRYDAYAAPQPIPSLRHLSSPRRQKGAVSSPESSTRSLSRASDTSSPLNDLTRTITPGELTLVAAQDPLPAPESSGKPEVVVQPAPQHELASRVDLITLDSPFVAEAARQAPADVDFQATWDSMENVDVRGWCEASLDMIVRLLQSLQYRMRVIATDQSPFEGELKVLVQGPSAQQYATLRLREGDEESCLWRLRCDDPELRTAIKTLMGDI